MHITHYMVSKFERFESVAYNLLLFGYLPSLIRCFENFENFQEQKSFIETDYVVHET